MSNLGRVQDEISKFNSRARRLRRAGAFLFGAAFLGLAGCATSVQPLAEMGVGEAPAAERVALVKAANSLDDTMKWPAPSTVSWMARLSGRAGGDNAPLSRDAAIGTYVDALETAGDPVSALAADADATLGAADSVILAAERALESLSPRMSDVAVLETAIKDLRDCRGIYLSALRRLDGSEEATRRTSAAIKAGFDRAVRQIGGLADALADRAAERQLSYAAVEPAAS